MKHVSTQQVIERLKSENPWWAAPNGIPRGMDSLKPRPYLDLLYPLIMEKTVNRAVVMMGPRRVGKTVLIHHAIAKLLTEGVEPSRMCYVSIDHPIYNSMSLDDLLNIYSNSASVDYKTESCYFFFDEIQYMKEWERYLKTLVDRFPNIRFLVSGSAAAALRLKSTESGAGRFTDFLLPPLTFYEYLLLLDKLDVVAPFESDTMEGFSKDNVEALNEYFIKYLNYGGYPEVIFSEEIQRDPGRFIKSDIIDKVLLRDLPGLYGIQDIQELNSLFTTLAYNTANEISLNELSKNSGIAKNTIKKYIEYLEAAFLIRIVHRVDRNARRFRRANFFKVYLTNPSIRTALFAPTEPNDDAIGSMVETAIFSQWFHDARARYYARWDKGEVDIVGLDAASQKAHWAVEVKWSDRYYQNPTELRSLISFCHAQNLERASVTTKTAYGSRFVENVKLEFVPAAYYCYILGRNILKSKFSSN